MLSLLKSGRFSKIMNAVAAGTSDQNSESVDVGTGRVATFIAQFGIITTNAVTSIKVQQSPTGTSGWQDLAGSKVDLADTDDNKIAIVEIENPVKRYVRLVVGRGTANAVISGVIAIVTRVKSRATIQASGEVAGSKILSSPEEGTA